MLSLTACSNTKLTYCERRDEQFIDEIIISSHFNIIDGITINSKIDLSQIECDKKDVDDYIEFNKERMDKYSDISLVENYIIKTQKYILSDMPLDDIRNYVDNSMCDLCFIGYKKTIEHLKYQGFYCANQ